ncbi:MAG: hypothetical protein BZY82_01675, partial [SAR202 cluster bacterium Io17-Chloro-G3]
MDELTSKRQSVWQSIIFAGLAAILVFSFGSPSRNVFAQDSELEAIEIQVTETVSASDTVEVQPIQTIDIQVAEAVTGADTVEVTQPGTIPPDFFGSIQGVNADTGFSADSKILTVMTTDGLTVMIVADQSTVISNPLKPEGIQEIEEGWNIMVSADKPPIPGPDTPRESMATANEITVIPDKPLGSHKRCTVIAQSSDGKSTLACEDGEQIDIEQTGLPAGTNAVLLIHPKQPGLLISTAKSLMERMSRFQESAKKQEFTALFSTFETLKKDVDAGFAISEELAASNAPPEVQQFMQNLEEVEQKIANLAAGFTSGGENIVASTSDITQLINMLSEIAGSPEKLCCPMIDGFRADVPQEAKDEAKALIESESSQFFVKMGDDLSEVITLLEEGDLEAALEKLDAATSDGESWTQNTVMPHATKFYADMEAYLKTESAAKAEKDEKTLKDAAEILKNANAEILTVEALLAGDTQGIDPSVKADINAKLDLLKEVISGNDTKAILTALTAMVELLQGFEGIPKEGQGQGQGQEKSSLADMVAAATLGIKDAEELLEANANTITSEDLTVILGSIAALKETVTGDNGDTIKTALEDLVAALEVLQGDKAAKSTSSTFVNLQCP